MKALILFLLALLLQSCQTRNVYLSQCQPSTYCFYYRILLKSVIFNFTISSYRQFRYSTNGISQTWLLFKCLYDQAYYCTGRNLILNFSQENFTVDIGHRFGTVDKSIYHFLNCIDVSIVILLIANQFSLHTLKQQ